MPWLAREGDADEHDRLDETAPDHDRLPAVLVGPHAPERNERHPDDEDQAREQPDEEGAVDIWHADDPEVRREEGEDLADAEALDHRGQPEDDDDPLPVGAAVALAGFARVGVGWHGDEA